MCLDLTKSSKIIKALEDKIVYKHAKYLWTDQSRIRSSYQYASIGELNKLPITKKLGVDVTTRNWKAQMSLYEHECAEITKGFHSFTSLASCVKDAKESDANMILQCIIPKGAYYVKGTFRLLEGAPVSSYVSTSITYVKVVKLLKS